jgi:hypothetical protein
MHLIHLTITVKYCKYKNTKNVEYSYLKGQGVSCIRHFSPKTMPTRKRPTLATTIMIASRRFIL